MKRHGLDTPVPWEPEVLVAVSGAQTEIYTCKLRGLNNGTLHVFSAKPITKLADVTVTFGAVMIRGTVIYSRPKNRDFLICIAFSAGPGKSGRHEPRVPAAQRCSLVALEEKGSVQLDAMITDISYSGVGVRMSRPIKIGTMICIQTGDFVAAGQVLHWHRIGEGQFSAGIHLTDILWGESGPAASSGRMKQSWLKRLWQTCRMQGIAAFH